jgi:PAS domain S-box-containing protein
MTTKLIKVLLVEDDPGDAFWIKELLEAAGRSLYRFELQHFSRLSEALEYLAVETPDAVLLDLGLPESQGMQTLRSIIDVAPHVPVVVLTGFADVEFGVAAVQKGAQDYLIKGQLNQDQLVRSLRYALERQRAEEALKKSQEQVCRQLAEIESIYDSAGVGLCVFDKQFRFTRINKRMAELNGVPVKDHIGRRAREVIPDLADQVEELQERILKTGEPVLDVELSGTTPAHPGVWRTWIEQWLPLKDSGGNFVGISVVAEEITERKQAEENLRRYQEELEQRVQERTADLNRTVEQLQFEMEERITVEEKLRESEDIFRGTFDQSPVGAVMVDQDLRFKRVNAAFCNLTGYSEEELKSLTCHDITHPDDLAAHLAEVQRLETGEIDQHDVEKLFLRKDGSPVWVRLTSRLIKDAAGRPLYFLAIIQDINARKQAEKTAEIDRQRFFSVLERMPAYVALLKPDYTIPFANREFVRRFGDPGNELCYEFLFGLKEPCEICKSHEVFQTKNPVIWEWAGPDGNTYQIYDYPFTDIDGSPLALEMGVDITTHKQSEDKLRRQTAMLAGINRVFREALTCKTEEELGVTCLAVAEELTGSPLGFIAELNPNGQFDALAFSERGWDFCDLLHSRDLALLKNINPGGLLAKSFREGRSLIANDPANHPEAAGLPPGHTPLTSYLGVPLKHAGKTIGLIGLGNKEGGYTQADQEAIETLAVAMVEALMRFRAEKKAVRFSRLYILLSKVNEAIVRFQDQATLFRQICRIAVEEGLFKMAWIGAVDQETGLVKAVVQHGLEEGYLERIIISFREGPESRGPTGSAIREGRYDTCNDIANDPRMSPWREEALSRGYRSSGAFPLRVGSRVTGSITVYAGEPGFFTDEEVSLLESLAQDVSFAMESMEREAQRRQAEAALKESEGRLRYLASQLIDAQEAERRRVSLELHDDLGQSLMVLTMQLRAIGKMVPIDQGEIRDHCNQTLNYLYEVIENVRRLARDLRPSILEDMGLPAALRHLVETFHSYHGIDVSLSMDEIKGLLAPQEEINIYRIFQEALTNIAKYAQANQVSLTIRKLAGRVSFRLEDNGTGFDMDHILARDASRKGLGLAAMEERVRMMGGSLEIWSREGKGTRINFMVPMQT